jgi:hypothetical protein
VSNTYKTRSSKGGLATVLLVAIIALLVWHELQQFLYGEPHFTFSVNKGVGHHIQVNVDLTVAMPCHCSFLLLGLNANDVLGSPDCGCPRRRRGSAARIRRVYEGWSKPSFRLVMCSSSEQTTFEIGQAQRLRNLEHIAEQKSLSASKAFKQARGKAKFSKTEHLVPDGPACRIYGAMVVKKVTGNLHIVRCSLSSSCWLRV